jgi:antibiotic biosynthesis monooxygenase (ABM) superfamily enzyme
MIARHWRGWTKSQNADCYEELLTTKVIPQLRGIAGYRGGYILRNDAAAESEFIVLNFFDSLEALRKFAGPNYTAPVFEPEAKALLSRFEPVANHYEVRAVPDER